MKYGPNITREVCKELENIPNIRYACKKVGIDHCTFYRWMYSYNEFEKAVTSSLLTGRMKISDVAEGNIISEVQRGDYKASVYFLSHNDHRYAPNSDKIALMRELDQITKKNLNKEPDHDSLLFNRLFKKLFLFEVSGKTKKYARDIMGPTIEDVFVGDPELKELFYASYEEWKNKKRERWEKMSSLDEHLNEADKDFWGYIKKLGEKKKDK